MTLVLLLAKGMAAQSYSHLYSIHPEASGSALGAKFGWSIAASSGRMVAGSPHFEAQHGRISILSIETFDPPPVPMHVTDILVNPTGNNPVQQRFGASLAMDDDWLAVGNCSPFGTSQYCNATADRVTVFQRNDASWQAYQTIQRPSGAGGGAFGKAIALQGDMLVIGGSRTSAGIAGRDVVYLYRRTGILWPTLPTDSMFGDGNLIGSEEAFGHALSLSANQLVVGASGDDELGSDCGAAYLYGRDHGGDGNWGLVRKLLPSNGAAGDRFGTAVALLDNRCVVGAPERPIGVMPAGGAYVYERDAGFQGNWGETAHLQPNVSAQADMDFGASVTIGPDLIAVGAPLEDVSAQGTDGSVHLFQHSGDWTHMQRIVPYADQVVSAVGRASTALAFHGEQLLIGAPFAIVSGLTPPGTSPTGVVLVYGPAVVGIPTHRQAGLRLWPNPCTDLVHFECDQGMVVRALLSDGLGRTVRSWGRIMHGSNTWSLEGVEPGSYYLQCALENGERITLPLVRH